MVCSAASATLVSPNPTLLSAKASSSTTSFSRSQTLSIPKSFHVLPNSFQHNISTRPISLARDACRSHSRRSFAVKAASDLPLIGNVAPDLKAEAVFDEEFIKEKSLLSVTDLNSFNNLTLKYWESGSIVCNSGRISSEPKLPIEKEKSMRVLLCTKVARLGLREKHKFLPLASAAEDFPARETLDLTEDHVKQVLADARVELGQIFDTSVGMTGEVDLAELDGPFVTIRLKGRFWHKRSTVVARLGNYLKQRIPEILEVDIENEKQLDDSPENF